MVEAVVAQQCSLLGFSNQAAGLTQSVSVCLNKSPTGTRVKYQYQFMRQSLFVNLLESGAVCDEQPAVLLQTKGGTNIARS